MRAKEREQALVEATAGWLACSVNTASDLHEQCMARITAIETDARIIAIGLETWSTQQHVARAAPLASLMMRLLEVDAAHARAIRAIASEIEPVSRSSGEADHVHLEVGTVSLSDVRAALFPDT